MGITLNVPQKLKTGLPYDTAILLLGICLTSKAVYSTTIITDTC